MKRTITINAPFCDTHGEVCPYLGPCAPEREDEQPPRIVCWGVEDEETRMGFWREVIHTFDPDGPGYRRHSDDLGHGDHGKTARRHYQGAPEHVRALKLVAGGEEG